MQFSRTNAVKILNDKKTETSRFWRNCRVRIDGVYMLKCGGWFGRPFARVRVTGVRKEKLALMNEESVKREGYCDLMEFLADLVRLNETKFGKASLAEFSDEEFADLMALERWAIRFEVVVKYGLDSAGEDVGKFEDSFE